MSATPGGHPDGGSAAAAVRPQFEAGRSAAGPEDAATRSGSDSAPGGEQTGTQAFLAATTDLRPGQLASVFFLTAIAVCILGFWAYKTEADHLRQREYGQLQAIADFKAAEIGDWLAERRWDALDLASNRFFRDDAQGWLLRPEAASRVRLEARLGSLRVNNNYLRVELLDRDGRSRLVAGPAGRDVAEPLSQRTRQASEPELIDLYREAGDGAIYLAYLLPLRQAAEASPFAYLRLTIDPDRHLYPLIRSWPTPSASAEVLLVRRDGDEVLFLNNLRHLPGAALNFRLPLSRESLPAARAVRKEEGVFEGRDYRGVPVLSYLRAIPGTPWHMVSKVDRQEVFADIERTARLAGFGVAVLIVGSGLLLWGVWRRQQLQARLDLEQGLARIAGMAPGALYVFQIKADGTRSFPYASPGIEALIGYSPRQLAGDTARMRARIHPDDLARVDGGIARSARAGTLWQEEFRYRHPGRGNIWLQGQATPQRLPDGSTVWYGYFSDITARKAAEQALAANQARLEDEVARRTAELERANAHLRAFTCAASHDLKAPLRGIDSFAALLERRSRGRLQGDEAMFLEHIRKNAARMTQLIEDLLAHARIEQQALVAEPIELAAVVAAAIGEWEAEIRERRTEIRVDLPPLRVLADPQGLVQVLRNLLENALKYSGRQAAPLVEIGAARSGGRCHLWVRDNGIGFDMADAEGIFEIFRRLHSYEEFPGTGIGLALVKKAVERMDGRIWAESSPDRGATFHVELPLADGEGGLQGEAAMPEPGRKEEKFGSCT